MLVCSVFIFDFGGRLSEWQFGVAAPGKISLGFGDEPIFKGDTLAREFRMEFLFQDRV